jgi:hypothetical protein
MSGTYRRKHRAELLGDMTNCPLCLQPFDFSSPFGKMYAVWEHCHVCRGWRGFTCNPCNARLEIYERLDAPEDWKQRVREYLAKHDCANPIHRMGLQYVDKPL